MGMKIGVMGTGVVGQVLGSALAGLGHEVMMGSRDAGNPKALEWEAKTARGSRSGTFADAARFGELIVLATLGTATEDVVKLAGAANLAGKEVMDTTNPLVQAEGGIPKLAFGFDDSLGERVQRLAPQASVVKCFNTVGNARMVQPKYAAGRPDMFICGNDENAKRSVTLVCDSLGWGVVDLGGIDCSRLLEPMALVWIYHGIRTRSWTHAFKLLQT